MAVKTKAKKKMEDVCPPAYQVARNIETMMRENHDTQDVICDLLGVSRTTFWRRQQKSPYEWTLMELDILCKYWGIGLDVLIRPPFERGCANA